MSVPLQTVPDSEDREGDSFEDESASQARHEAAEILARARREAEAIVAEARSSSLSEPSPLAALGDNAEEIIGQVRKLIKKQRELQTERESMVAEIAALQSERDELVHRLTDAVERMEELAALANQSPSTSPPQATVQTPPAPRPKPTPMPPRAEQPAATPPPPPPPPPAPRDVVDEDTSLAARLRKAEQEEGGGPEDAEGREDTSLAARLKKAEESESNGSARAARMAENEKNIAAAVAAERATADMAEYDDLPLAGDGRSFYDRHSAKLPRLEGDGGRSVLSAMGGMRPDLEVKGRKGRRSRKK